MTRAGVDGDRIGAVIPYDRLSIANGSLPSRLSWDGRQAQDGLVHFIHSSRSVTRAGADGDRIGAVIPYDRLSIPNGSLPSRLSWDGASQAQDGLVHFVTPGDPDRCERLTKKGLNRRRRSSYRS